MKQIRISTVVLCFILFLNGCAVVTTDFYQPSGDQIELTGAACSNGINNTALLKRDEVFVYLKIVFAETGEKLILTLEVPENQTVELLTNSLQINQQSVPLPTVQVYDQFKLIEYPDTHHFEGAGIRKWRLVISNDTPIPRVFVYIHPMPQHQSHYSVQLPAMKINGAEMHFPLIQFEQRHKTHVSPINC